VLNNANLSHSRQLVVLWKKQATKMGDYADGVETFLRTSTMQPGFMAVDL
jgi:hypothetical protein